MNVVIQLFGITQFIVFWGTLVAALSVLIKSLISILKNQGNFKAILIAVVSLIYIAIFAISKIFYSETFDMVASVLFIFFGIVSTQLVKHEDRKAGRIW